MKIPIVDGRRKPTLDDRAAAFWAVARSMEQPATSRDFEGDLSGFGFLPDRSSAILRKAREAMIFAADVTPDLRSVIGSDKTPKNDQVVEKIDRMENDPHCQFWTHSTEDTLAITRPYSFQRPYGQSSMVLMNFDSDADVSQQFKRSGRLAALDIAQYATTEFIHVKSKEAYVAKGGALGTTFAFAKFTDTGGRDRQTTVSSGFSLSKTDAKSNDSSANIPFLFLEIFFDELAL